MGTLHAATKAGGATERQQAEGASSTAVGSVGHAGALVRARGALTPAAAAALQRSYGNQAVRRYAESLRGPLTRAAAVSPAAGSAAGTVQRDALDDATTLGELHQAKTGLRSQWGQSHTKWEREARVVSTKVRRMLRTIAESFAEQPLVPAALLGLGSLGRGEVLMVSDADVLVMMIGPEADRDASLAWAARLQNHVRDQWANERATVGINGNGLDLEWIDGGVKYEVDAAGMVGQMRVKKMIGAWSDLYADAVPLATMAPQNGQGLDYDAVRAQYEGAQDPANVLGDALGDLQALQGTKAAPAGKSAKHLFVRPVTVGVSALYRMHRRALGADAPAAYETNTLRRAEVLGRAGILTAAAVADIKELVLRALKWEEEAGLATFMHGQNMKADRTKWLHRKFNAMADKGTAIGVELRAGQGLLPEQ